MTRVPNRWAAAAIAAALAAAVWLLARDRPRAAQCPGLPPPERAPETEKRAGPDPPHAAAPAVAPAPARPRPQDAAASKRAGAARVETLFAYTRALDADAAALSVFVQVRNAGARDADANVRVEISEPGASRPAAADWRLERLAAGESRRVAFDLELKSPRLWRPMGQGAGALYVVRAAVQIGGEETAAAETQIGVRVVTAGPAADPAAGCETGLRINAGPPMRLLASVWRTDAPAPAGLSCERLLKTAAAAGWNAVFVQGGPAPEALYDWCDRLGLLVLQHIPLALPADPHASTLDALRRAWTSQDAALANHPCIALWCVGDRTLDGPADERVREAVRLLAGELDPSRPWAAAFGPSQPIEIWTPSHLNGETMWSRVAIRRFPGVWTLDSPDALAKAFPQDDPAAFRPADAALRAVAARARRYGRPQSWADLAARSRLDQILELERRAAEWLTCDDCAGGVIAGRLNPAAALADLASADASPAPALYWRARHAERPSIFIDSPLCAGDALVLRRGESAVMNVLVANPSGRDYPELYAVAKLLKLNNELIDSAAARVSAAPGSLQRAFEFAPVVPNDCREKTLLLWLSLHDAQGHTLADSVLWFGVDPNFRQGEAVRVLVVADDESKARTRWGFLRDYGFELHIAQPPAEQPVPAPEAEPAEEDYLDGAAPGAPGDAGEEDQKDPSDSPAAPDWGLPADAPAQVIVLDASRVGDRALADLAARVAAGAGLLIVGSGEPFAGSPIEPLSPIEPGNEEAFDYGGPPAARLPGHPALAGVGVARIAASGPFYRYALKPDAAVIADRGRGRPMMAEAAWKRGRVLMFTRNMTLQGDAAARTIVNALAYLAGLSYPQQAKLREPASRAAYAGLASMPRAQLRLVARIEAAKGRVRLAVVNDSAVMALACHLDAPGLDEGERVDFSDNDFHLPPGQERVVIAACQLAGERAKDIVFRARAFNAAPAQARAAAPARAPRILRADAAPNPTPKWGLAELTVRLDKTYANPFTDASVEAEFEGPGGEKIAARGFYDGDHTWRVRFSPTQAGAWRWRVTARDAAGQADAAGELQAGPAEAPGFPRVDTAHPRRLVLSDGSPFTILGGGCFSPWEPWATGGLDYREYLRLHRESRMNAARVFLYQEFHRGEAREAMVNLLAEGAADRFDVSMCRRVDEFLRAARSDGVFVDFVLFDHWPVKNDWTRYAYSAHNAGACLERGELFSRPDARRQQEFFIDYVLARWAAFGNVLAWELWNECNLADGDLLKPDGPLMQWHRRVAAYVRRRDPYRHLLFTSFSSGVTDKDWYAEPWNELMSYHHYAAYCGGEARDVDVDLWQTFEPFAKLRKPMLLAELGYEKQRNDARPVKREYLRVAAWTSAFLGAGVILWDDADFRITPDTRGDLRRLAAFFSDHGLADARPLPGPQRPLGRSDVRVWVRAAADGSLCAFYAHHGETHDRAAPAARVAVPFDGVGRYQLVWIDPATGERKSEQVLSCRGALVFVPVPSLQVDAAGVMRRVGP